VSLISALLLGAGARYSSAQSVARSYLRLFVSLLIAIVLAGFEPQSVRSSKANL
jgi:hypothetical protein